VFPKLAWSRSREQFLHCGLRKFRHSKWYTGDIHISVRSRFVYDTYRTMEATRSRHGRVHMFITHCPTVTLQLHNFDLFRTCRTSSFCTVVWQLARFQLTRRIAWSLCDSWVSCCIVQDEKLSSSKITLCRRSLLKKADVKNRLSSMPDVRVIDRNRFPRTLSGDGLVAVSWSGVVGCWTIQLYRIYSRYAV